MRNLDLDLPDPFPSFGTYVTAVVDGDTLYTAGQVPFDGTTLITGKLGGQLTVEQGYDAARIAAVPSTSATIRHELGDLARVCRWISLTGTVNATSEFTQHTQVIDGASDLLVEVFGEAGTHARLAVGVNSLPADMALEIHGLDHRPPSRVRPKATTPRRIPAAGAIRCPPPSAERGWRDGETSGDHA